jgi:hypothetical protein
MREKWHDLDRNHSQPQRHLAELLPWKYQLTVISSPFVPTTTMRMNAGQTKPYYPVEVAIRLRDSCD